MKALIIEDEDLVAAELKAKIRLVAGDIDIIDILPSIKTKALVHAKCGARSYFHGHPVERWR